MRAVKRKIMLKRAFLTFAKSVRKIRLYFAGRDVLGRFHNQNLFDDRYIRYWQYKGISVEKIKCFKRFITDIYIITIIDAPYIYAANKARYLYAVPKKRRFYLTDFRVITEGNEGKVYFKKLITIDL